MEKRKAKTITTKYYNNKKGISLSSEKKDNYNSDIADDMDLN